MLMQPSKSQAFHQGLILVSELLHAAGEQKREFIHAIYQLLMQDSHYLSNHNITVKPFEMISVYSSECIEEYLKFVVKLAREGLSREFVLNLLGKKEHSLLPKFWVEVARQNDQQLLEFISSGFLTGAEYQKFVDAKAQLFGCVLKMDDADKKRAYLENIVDDKHPLGKLFLLKAKSDYRYINKRNGYLKVASDALQQLVPQQMMSGFAKTGAVDSRPRPGAQTTLA